jgi:hypothetical protein
MANIYGKKCQVNGDLYEGVTNAAMSCVTVAGRGRYGWVDTEGQAGTIHSLEWTDSW